jgi:hypothetical protein
VNHAVRFPAVAGSFYPGDQGTLTRLLDDLLAGVPDDAGPRPAAVIVPHAGYQYSGVVAATAYALLRRWRSAIRTVVLLGPSHFVPVSGAALPEADVLRTPLGDVTVVGADLVQRRLAVRQMLPHVREHSLEVQLPFLQRVLVPGWVAVPLLLGRATPADLVADCLDALAGDDVLVVVSSDLSHYHDHESAQRLDRRTADTILARSADQVGDHDACGAMAIRGAIVWAIRRDLSVSELDLRTSADTAGDPQQVVGYGAFALGAA